MPTRRCICAKTGANNLFKPFRKWKTPGEQADGRSVYTEHDVLYSAWRFLYIRASAGGVKDVDGWKVGTSAKESPFKPLRLFTPIT